LRGRSEARGRPRSVIDGGISREAASRFDADEASCYHPVSDEDQGEDAMTGDAKSKTSPENATNAVEAAPTRPRFEDLPPAAQRALKEAEERRKAADAAAVPRPKELMGRDGPEPVRYGDWELKGIASDF
jgi:hypothetical protein